VVQWDPGDASDVVEGGAGSDTLVFNGSNIGEIFEASANGGRVVSARNIATITMDLDDVEPINVRSLGGTDTLTVNDLAGRGRRHRRRRGRQRRRRGKPDGQRHDPHYRRRAAARHAPRQRPGPART
jgi:Ca2+-binding RTX toxin-like protein